MDKAEMLLCKQRQKRGKTMPSLADVQEESLIKYLSSCFIRCNIEEMKLTSVIKEVIIVFTQPAFNCSELAAEILE